MVGVFRPQLFLAGLGAIGAGIWIMVSGGGTAFGFPLDLPQWMLIWGKDVAVGSLAVLVGLVVLTIAFLVKPGDYEKRNPPSTSQIEPGD